MKSYLRHRAPAAYHRLQDWKYRWVPSRWLGTDDLSMAEVNWLVLEEFDRTVSAGPFAGMKYIGESRNSILGAKILGIYEREIRGAIEQAIRTPYDVVIDIGSAEGYYAVGFARRMPHATVHAYDADPDARIMLGQLARANEVEQRVIVHDTCGPRDLNQFHGRSAFLLCDIDGGEVEVLDPEAAPALLDMDILVEIHDGPGSTAIRDLLTRRFGESHEADWFAYEGRVESEGRSATWLRTPHARRLAVDERRVKGLAWAFFRRRVPRRPFSAC